MNKIIIILLTFLLVGCASYKPVADLKASKNANDYQEDRQHCKLLIKEEFNMPLGMTENYYHDV